MKKLSITLLLVLAVAASWLAWALANERQTNRQLAARLAGTEITLSNQQSLLAQSRANVDALGNKIGQLTMVLTNSTFELSAARRHIQQLEAQPDRPLSPLASLPKDEATQRQVARYAPAIAVSTNAIGREERTFTFKTLYGRDDQVLGSDLEFSGVYGKRVAFKEVAQSRRMAFDVDELHPYVLAHLGINPDTQKQQQARQEEIWRRAEAAGLKLAAEEESRREARRAAEEAARIEAEKQMAQQREKEFQQELQRRALENEALRSAAAMRAADAALIQALTPPVIINNPIRIQSR